MKYFFACTLSLVCAVHGGSSPPIHGSTWDKSFTCPAISYPHDKAPCRDGQCSGVGNVCLSCGGKNHTNFGACCQEAQLPAPKPNGKYPCQRQHISGETNLGELCQWRCCSAPQSVPCGDGCCKPADHGHPKKCGATLAQADKSRKKCCIPSGADPQEQTDSKCCLHSDGVNCKAPSPVSHMSLHDPCCLWTEYRRTVNGSKFVRWDPHSPCQIKDCTEYDPCPHGEGYQCNSNARQYKFAERVCCLQPSTVDISEFDTCQRRSSDCETRWQPCPHGVGSDCSRDGRACCLSDQQVPADNICQRDCRNYHPRMSAVMVALIISLVVLVVAMVLVAGCYARHRRLHNRQAEMNVAGPVTFPALVIANSDYLGRFKPLPQAKRDGEEMVKMLHEAGYDVIPFYNAGRNDMNSLRKQLLQRLGNIEGAIVPIYFAGHGLEAAGTTFLVPVDAQTLNPDEHISLSSFLQLPREAHVPTRANEISCAPIISPLFYCLLDCCRELVREEDGVRFAAAAARDAKPPPRRRQADAAEIAVMYACDKGDFAQEADGHGYFTKAVLEHARDDTLSLLALAKKVGDQVKTETSEMQQRDSAVRIQKPFLDAPISAKLDDRSLWRFVSRRRSSSGEYSYAASTSAPSVIDDTTAAESGSATSELLANRMEIA